MYLTTHPRRLLASAAVATALAGALAACGDDSTTSQAGSGQGTMMQGSSPMRGTTATSPASIDAAFVRQMIPHHALAVQMARSAERRASHSELKTLARGIVAAQEEEITTMRTIAKAKGYDLDGATTMMGGDARTMGLGMGQMGMSMDVGELDAARPYDPVFIDMMIPHHAGAIRMAKVELARGENPELKALARAIVSAQEKEIAEMRSWREAWFGTAEPTTDMGDMHDEHAMHGM